MSEYLGVPQFERIAEPVSDPFESEAEIAHYADFLWGKNSPDLSQPPRWWFDDRFEHDLVATDGKRWFIASDSPEYPVREVLVVKHGDDIEVAGLTHPTSYRRLSPLGPGETATTRNPNLQIQYFWF